MYAGKFKVSNLGHVARAPAGLKVARTQLLNDARWSFKRDSRTGSTIYDPLLVYNRYNFGAVVGFCENLINAENIWIFLEKKRKISKKLNIFGNTKGTKLGNIGLSLEMNSKSCES